MSEKQDRTESEKQDRAESEKQDRAESEKQDRAESEKQGPDWPCSPSASARWGHGIRNKAGLGTNLVGSVQRVVWGRNKAGLGTKRSPGRPGPAGSVGRP